jgi:glucose-1-phosphate cytidylyltransferase
MMRAVILAGGLGTRLAEETQVKPKPMVEVGGHPILWHIMKIFSAAGIREFVVCLGYRGDVVKDYFANYLSRNRSITVDLRRGDVRIHDGESEDWIVHLLDTGLHTETAGRILRASRFIGDEPFLMTYGDGVCSMDMRDLIEFHQRHGRLATVTAVRPPARFGGIEFNGDLVSRFTEKPQIGEGWINGGFFVLEPGIRDYIASDHVVWEREPMEALTLAGELAAYRHTGFWQCVDTLRDLRLLERLWQEADVPWRIW